jgi:hypothetical protein
MGESIAICLLRDERGNRRSRPKRLSQSQCCFSIPVMMNFINSDTWIIDFVRKVNLF